MRTRTTPDMKMLFYRLITTIPILGAGITQALQRLDYGLDEREFNSLQIFFFSEVSRPFLEPPSLISNRHRGVYIPGGKTAGA
jgi:hypothetical protein